MPHPIKVVLLYGGKSGEHEVSLRSAASVLAHLDARKYQVIPVGIDKDGALYINPLKALQCQKNSLPVRLEESQPLDSLIKNGHFTIDAQCVFPVTHGPLYEDGCLQGILTQANIAFVGSNVLASAIGMDKDMSRRIVCDASLRSARYGLVNWHMEPAQKREILVSLVEECSFPLFVKPCSLGSSVGVGKVNTIEEGLLAIEDALRYDNSALIEECITGREIEVAVLEHPSINKTPLCSVPGEVLIGHEDGFYSYNAKYLQSNSTELIVPAQLSETTISKLQAQAAKIFFRLKCSGMARVDFFVKDDGGEIIFNEINTLPGFTSISMYPLLWQHSGIAYTELLERLISLALSHQAARLNRLTSFF